MAVAKINSINCGDVLSSSEQFAGAVLCETESRDCESVSDHSKSAMISGGQIAAACGPCRRAHISETP